MYKVVEVKPFLDNAKLDEALDRVSRQRVRHGEFYQRRLVTVDVQVNKPKDGFDVLLMNLFIVPEILCFPFTVIREVKKVTQALQSPPGEQCFIAVICGNYYAIIWHK